MVDTYSLHVLIPTRGLMKSILMQSFSNLEGRCRYAPQTIIYLYPFVLSVSIDGMSFEPDPCQIRLGFIAHKK